MAHYILPPRLHLYVPCENEGDVETQDNRPFHLQTGDTKKDIPHPMNTSFNKTFFPRQTRAAYLLRLPVCAPELRSGGKFLQWGSAFFQTVCAVILENLPLATRSQWVVYTLFTNTFVTWRSHTLWKQFILRLWDKDNHTQSLWQVFLQRSYWILTCLASRDLSSEPPGWYTDV